MEPGRIRGSFAATVESRYRNGQFMTYHLRTHRFGTQADNPSVMDAGMDRTNGHPLEICTRAERITFHGEDGSIWLLKDRYTRTPRILAEPLEARRAENPQAFAARFAAKQMMIQARINQVLVILRGI